MRFNWRFTSILFNALWMQCHCSDLYSDNVRKYDQSEFRENVGKGNPHFINFFAPWCGYCKRLKPVWDELADKYNTNAVGNKVIIAKVDCTVETPLCAEHGVGGYPSLIFFQHDSTEGIKYKGKRELPLLEEFIIQSTKTIKEKSDQPKIPVTVGDEISTKTSSGVVELTDSSFHTNIDLGSHFVKFYAPWCGHCQSLAPTWEELAKTFESDKSISISKVDCTEHRQACSEFEIKRYPTLIFIHNGKKIENFSGDRTLPELKQFIDKMKETVVLSAASTTDDEKVPENMLAPDKGDLVVLLTADNFDNAVKDGVTFVNFFAPWCGHCRKLKPTWEALALKFVTNSNVRIAKVDCTIDTELCKEYKVEGFPTLLLFRKGEKIQEFIGARDLESLHKFVEEHSPHDEL